MLMEKYALITATDISCSSPIYEMPALLTSTLNEGICAKIRATSSGFPISAAKGIQEMPYCFVRLAKELAPSGIQVNAIACGVIDTDMNSCFSAEDMEMLRQEISKRHTGNAVLFCESV